MIIIIAIANFAFVVTGYKIFSFSSTMVMPTSTLSIAIGKWQEHTPSDDTRYNILLPSNCHVK